MLGPCQDHVWTMFYQTLQKLESTYMTINRLIRGGLTFKVKSEKICKEIKADPPSQHMLKVAVQYIHKHLNHKKCNALIDELVIPKRSTSHIYVKKPQNGTYTASLDKIIKIYNLLPASAKLMTMRQFKKYCRKNDIKSS